MPKSRSSVGIASNVFTNKSHKRMYSKKKPSVYTLAKKIRSIEKSQKADVEMKELTAPLSIAPGTTPLFNLLSNIDEGLTEVTRVGIEVNPKRLDLYLRTQVGDSFNTMRFIVFRWFDNTPPTLSDILYSNSSGTFTGQLYIDIPTKWVSKPRFQILDDQRLTVDADDPVLSYQFEYRFKKNAKISYNGSLGTNIENNNIYLLYMSDSVAIPYPVSDGYFRLTFADA